jgi:hypothetical protein
MRGLLLVVAVSKGRNDEGNRGSEVTVKRRWLVGEVPKTSHCGEPAAGVDAKQASSSKRRLVENSGGEGGEECFRRH